MVCQICFKKLKKDMKGCCQDENCRKEYLKKVNNRIKREKAEKEKKEKMNKNGICSFCAHIFEDDEGKYKQRLWYNGKIFVEHNLCWDCIKNIVKKALPVLRKQKKAALLKSVGHSDTMII
jgi:hypothetical protein